tara:strand:+ start:1341 stop:1772 length:432 start_codon:yes stop_codon:yes gene_type:complete
MQETKFVQGKLIKQVYKDEANNFVLERKDGTKFGLIYKQSPVDDYEVGTTLFAPETTLYMDDKIKVYETLEPPMFKFSSKKATSINKEGDIVPNPKIKTLPKQEQLLHQILSTVEVMAALNAQEDIEKIRMLAQELTFKRMSG